MSLKREIHRKRCKKLCKDYNKGVEKKFKMSMSEFWKEYIMTKKMKGDY